MLLRMSRPTIRCSGRGFSSSTEGPILANSQQLIADRHFRFSKSCYSVSKVAGGEVETSIIGIIALRSGALRRPLFHRFVVGPRSSHCSRPAVQLFLASPVAAAHAGMPVWGIPNNAGRTLLARQRRFSLSPGAVALTVISVIVGVGSCVGFLARYHHKMDLDQWIVGGRGFGLILVWVLTAGELFTTFTFLGASGWAYAKGAPVYYILGYAPLACVVTLYLLPPVWEVGQRFQLQTQADFFQVRYGQQLPGGTCGHH